MNWGRFPEFFEDMNGKFATPSALQWLGVIALTIVIIIDACYEATSPAVITAYASLIAALAGIKKGFDNWEKRARIKASAPPSPPPPEPPPPPSPITINAGSNPASPVAPVIAKDVKVEAKGDVTVTKKENTEGITDQHLGKGNYD